MRVNAITTISLQCTLDEFQREVVKMLSEKYQVSIEDVNIDKSSNVLTITGKKLELGVAPKLDNIAIPLPFIGKAISKPRGAYGPQKYRGVSNLVRDYLEPGTIAPFEKIVEYVKIEYPDIPVRKVKDSLMTMKDIIQKDPGVWMRVALLTGIEEGS